MLCPPARRPAGIGPKMRKPSTSTLFSPSGFRRALRSSPPMHNAEAFGGAPDVGDPGLGNSARDGDGRGAEGLILGGFAMSLRHHSWTTIFGRSCPPQVHNPRRATVAMESRIKLTYDGPLVDRGRIPAVAVGKGIIGMTTLVSRAGQILHGKKARVVSAIEPRFARSSFEIHFVFDLHPLIELGLFTTIFVRLFGHLRRSKREVTRETDRLSPIDEMAADPRLRTGLGGLVSPLKRGEVDYLTIGDRADVPEFESVLINHHEAPLFRGTGVLSRSETEEVYIVIKPSFRRRTVWTLARESDGRAFSAYMNDHSFMDAVRARQIAFQSGSRIHARLRTTVTNRYGRIETRHEITRVFNHS